ncbi:MAG: hypothetical protein ACI9FJ_000719 [Alteromonadaceae bacterium]
MVASFNRNVGSQKNDQLFIGFGIIRPQRFLCDHSVRGKPMKIKLYLAIAILLSGCAGGRLDIMDQDGKIVGECIAGYDWHFDGLEDSIDYALYQCAKESIEKGHTISDKSLLALDFTLPQPPDGNKLWNKKRAMAHFHAGDIKEQQLGYILAAIELEYMMIGWAAQADLAAGKISQTELDQIIKAARFIWLGE